MDEEHKIQCALIEWCDALSGVYPELRLLYANANGGHRDIRTAVKLKREGVRRGVPDLTLPVRRKGFSGLYIELKTSKGRLTPEQSEWLSDLNYQGFLAVCCHGLTEAIDAIAGYMGIPVINH